MSSIDERIVAMKFNNGQFEQGISKTMESLDGLKKGLNLDGATKSVAGLGGAISGISAGNLAGLTAAAEFIADKFTVLGIAGVTALANITTMALQTGAQLLKSLTIDPILSGMSEYETLLNSIQTILANTESKGETLESVNVALQELNKYSDQTIYNFQQMARNIGTFTAAGVDLDTAVNAIKGIANLAAVSGSSADQASTAMYQLSQALATGTVRLMDWNSVVNAGMGGEVFQNALKQTARVHGIAVDEIIKNEGSFRDSLQTGWLTSGILTETLMQFTGDLTAAQLQSMGYNDEQIAGILKMGATAQDAATKVKTVSQLIQTLQESAQSGWALTWQLIFGDFEQAKKLFTNVNDVLGAMIQKSADDRNAVLATWDALNGRVRIIEAISNVFEYLMKILVPIRGAFEKIFPPITGEMLALLSYRLLLFTERLELSSEAFQNIRRTAAGFFALLSIAWQIIKAVGGLLFDLLGFLAPAGAGFLNITGNVGDFIVAIDKALKEGTLLTDFFHVLGEIIKVPLVAIKFLVTVISELFNSFRDLNGAGFEGFFERVGARLGPLGKIGEVLLWIWTGLGKILDWVQSLIAPLFEKLTSGLNGSGEALGEAFKNFDFNAIIDILNVGLFGGLLTALFKFLGTWHTAVTDVTGMFKSVSGFLSSITGITDSIKAVFGQLQAVLQEFQTSIKARTLLTIAAAIGIIVLSVIALSLIDTIALTKAIAALALLFTMLVGAMSMFEKVAAGPSIAKLPVLAGAMILLAIAVRIFTASVTALSKLDWVELAKGMSGLGVMLGLLVGYSKAMGKSAPQLVSGGIGLIVFATGIRLLVSSVTELAGYSWEELAKGVAGVAAIMSMLIGFSKAMGKSKTLLLAAINMLILGGALKIIASALGDFAGFSLEEIGKGMLAIGAALVAIGIGMRLLPNNMLLSGTALVIVAQALTMLSEVFAAMASIPWDGIGRGMVVLVGTLGIVVLALAGLGAIGPIVLVGAVALLGAAAALLIMAGVMKQWGDMDWESIGKAMAMLGGTLGILAVGLILMVGALPGAAALGVVAVALLLLAPVLTLFSKMSWDEIGRGLFVLGATLGILALAGILLIPALPGLLGLGAAIMLLGLGALAAGVGVLAFATGLTALAGAAALGGAVIGSMIDALITKIPAFAVGVAQGLLEFLGVIVAAAPQVLEAVVSLLSTFIEGIITVAPMIVNAIFTLVQMLADTLVANVPMLVEKGFALLLGILDGIANNIERVVTVALLIIERFINGIANGLPGIIEAGANLVITFVESLADTINNNAARMRQAGLDLAFAIVDGMTGGLLSGASNVIDAAVQMAGNALNAVKDILGIASPSKETFAVGMFFDDGAANGMVKGIPTVVKAAEKVGDASMTALKKSITGVGAAISSDLNMEPTIRPVLDLSAIRKDSSQIANLLSVPKLSLGASYDSAKMISAESQARAEQNATDDLVTSSGETNITLIQNNNSPKSLSTADIYRQTRNQISTAKGELTGAK